MNMSIRDAAPIWGIVDESYQNSVELQTVLGDVLYLPASNSLYTGSVVDTISSATIPGAVLWRLYPAAKFDGIIPLTLDYTGTTNYAIRNKWTELGASTKRIAMMIDLIYVDIMTQWIVGSKSVADINPNGVVQLLQPRIRYDLRFAIPVSPHLRPHSY